jgi:hypothetical protein
MLNITDLTLKYGDISYDVANGPAATAEAMIRRGFAHLLGNECAAKVTAYFKENPEEDTAEARAAMKAEVQQAMLAKMVAGTLGVSTRGPAVDPFEAILARVAKSHPTLGVVKTLKDNGLAFPKKGETVTVQGVAYTGDELVKRRIASAKFAADIKKEAEKILRDQQKKAKDAASLPKGSVEDL